MSYSSNSYYTSPAAPGRKNTDMAASLARKAAKAGVNHLLNKNSKPSASSGYGNAQMNGYGGSSGYSGSSSGFGGHSGNGAHGSSTGKKALVGLLAKEGKKFMDKKAHQKQALGQQQGQGGYGGQQQQWRDDQAFGGFAHPSQQAQPQMYGGKENGGQY